MKAQSRQSQLPVSEQMKAWSTAISAELGDWPQITLKSFFGFMALYRRKAMFGLLPRTRSIFKDNAVAFRLQDAHLSRRLGIEQDSRVTAFDKDKTRWFAFRLSSNADLHDALQYLSAAYDAAGSANTKPSQPK